MAIITRVILGSMSIAIYQLVGIGVLPEKLRPIDTVNGAQQLAKNSHLAALLVLACTRSPVCPVPPSQDHAISWRYISSSIWTFHHGHRHRLRQSRY